MKARTHHGSMAQVPGETVQKKFSKIVTFKLDESLDQKQQQVAATTTTNDEEAASVGLEEEQ